jgi:pimeloyl-ACP methyl ester carboxylesterase
LNRGDILIGNNTGFVITLGVIMTLMEMAIFCVPALWLVFRTAQGKWRLAHRVRLAVIAAGCLGVSLNAALRFSNVPGGGLLWGEVIRYAWLVFAIVVLALIVAMVVRHIVRLLTAGFSRSPLRSMVITVIAWGVTLILIMPLYLAMTSVHVIKVGNAFTPLQQGMKYEDVSLRTGDGVGLRAWFVPAPSDKAVIIVHGLNVNRANYMDSVARWHQLGMNVLIMDLRGHGASGGHVVSFGRNERKDFFAALEYLEAVRKFDRRNIWGYGVSFGGAVMLNAAAEIKGLGGVIIDSSFADLDDMAGSELEGKTMMPKACLVFMKKLGLGYMRLDLGFDIRRYSPYRLAGKLAGTPVLFIHGRGDTRIPWQQSQRLYDSASTPRQIILLDTQGHFNTPNDPHYMDILRRFTGMGKEPPLSRARRVDAYLAEFSAPVFGSSKIGPAIRDVLMRLPEDALDKVMDRRRPVLLLDVNSSGTGRFASSSEVMMAPQDAPAFEEGMTLIKISDELADGSSEAVKGIIAHELAHRVLDHVRQNHLSCNAEREANRLIKSWGFTVEYEAASREFGRAKAGDGVASCRPDR